MNTRESGKRGEEAAEEFLKSRGMESVLRNFRSPCGEVDLIMTDCDTLVFIEVKTGLRYGPDALEFSVGFCKQRRIIETAKYFLLTHRKYIDMRVRFDVVFVQIDTFTHLAQAFSESV
ncbi:MAG: YraN family protein [Spirochaetaceae bacterium]|jgi:putative endonuclease|nr:YraN family protein [Spirochaetaceae bacterium]